MTDPVFLLGNGKSRQHFDLERLRQYGTIIGCNAIYRDFSPDILISIDAKMLRELSAAGYKDSKIIVPNNRSVNVPEATRWKTDKFNTSGCFAMQLIGAEMGPKLCFMLGMDAYTGNVYDKTKNYAVNSLVNFSGIKKYYMQSLGKSKHTTFVNVNDQDAWPEAAHDTGKYECISYEEFEKVLKNMALYPNWQRERS